MAVTQKKNQVKTGASSVKSSRKGKVSPSVNKPQKDKTQGELLDELQQWSLLAAPAFAATYGKRRHQFMKDRDEERLTLKDKYALCGYHNIPMSYWDGLYILLPKNITPNTHGLSMAQEGDAVYNTNDIESLRAEIKKLATQLAEAKQAITDRDNQLVEANKTILDQSKSINALIARIS